MHLIATKELEVLEYIIPYVDFCDTCLESFNKTFIDWKQRRRDSMPPLIYKAPPKSKKKGV